MNFRARKQRSSSAIDITALVDVVFLLLIFLLVTTQFKKDEEQAFIVDAPTSSTKSVTISTAQTTVYVDADGAMHLLIVAADAPAGASDRANAQKVTEDQLRQQLATIFERRPDAPISIKGEKSTPYQRIVDVMSIVQGVGFRTVSFPYTHQPGGSGLR